MELRNDIVKLLSTRRENRQTRRSRKTRYRAPRFDNRKASKQKGWLAPSIRHKIQTHLTVVEHICQILPISKIVVETASFDTQLLKAQELGLPIPQGKDYQIGEMLGWNAREYALFRDNHCCQHCHGKSKDKVLEVHHIESRKTGGDAPNNLITLCQTCHKNYHFGLLEGFVPKRGRKYNDAAFMGIMRWEFYNVLKERYPNVSMTFGFLTKSTRIRLGLEKEHYNDAYCIAGNLSAVPLETALYQKKVRCHNRQIHKSNPSKGGNRKRNQAPYIVKRFRLFDKVKCNGVTGFIFGRRATGSFDVRKLDGTKISSGITYNKLELLEVRSSYLKEERSRQFLPPLK